MAKILISSIGVGNREKYNSANYKIDDKIYENEKFIANVLCEHIGIDKLFLIGTKKSIWEAVCKEFGGNDELELEVYEAKEQGRLNDVLHIIEKTIDTKLKTNGSKCFVIEYGLNDDELWRNFDKFLQIAENFAKNDQIYMDITHSFRSLSLMSFVMSEFISNSLDDELDIKGVYYGMLDYAKENNNISPIVDLSMFFELLKWSKAIRELKKYGNARSLLQLLQNSNDEMEKDVLNRFRNFTNALSMSDIVSLKSSVANLKTKLSFFKDSDIKIYNLISKDLQDFIKIFDVSSLSKIQYNMAQWYFEAQNYALSYMMLAEAVVSAVAEDNGLDANNEDSRKEAKYIIYRRTKQAKQAKLARAKDDEYTTYRYKINKIRTFVAHALDKDGRKTKIQVKDAVENLPLYIDKVKGLFKNKK